MIISNLSRIIISDNVVQVLFYLVYQEKYIIIGFKSGNKFQNITCSRLFLSENRWKLTSCGQGSGVADGKHSAAENFKINKAKTTI